MNPVDLFAYTAAVLLMGMSIPQTIKAHMHGVEGISTATWATITTAIAMWLAYGIRSESLVLIIANVAALATTAAMLFVLVRARDVSVIGSIALVTACCVSLTLVGLLVPMAVVTIAAVVLPIVSRMPQLLASLQSYRLGTATAVSRTTWLMSALGQSLWLAYGLILGDPALIIVNAACVALTVVLLAADFANVGNRRRVGGLAAA